MADKNNPINHPDRWTYTAGKLNRTLSRQAQSKTKIECSIGSTAANHELASSNQLDGMIFSEWSDIDGVTSNGKLWITVEDHNIIGV